MVMIAAVALLSCASERQTPPKDAQTDASRSDPEDFRTKEAPHADAQMADASALDASVPDGMVLDLLMPDAMVPDVSRDLLPAGCTGKYGSATGFLLCKETAVLAGVGAEIPGERRFDRFCNPSHELPLPGALVGGKTFGHVGGQLVPGPFVVGVTHEEVSDVKAFLRSLSPR